MRSLGVVILPRKKNLKNDTKIALSTVTSIIQNWPQTWFDKNPSVCHCACQCTRFSSNIGPAPTSKYMWVFQLARQFYIPHLRLGFIWFLTFKLDLATDIIDSSSQFHGMSFSSKLVSLFKIKSNSRRDKTLKPYKKNIKFSKVIF